ncbi:MAG: EAL domain-containing protein, partial [Guyparkeria sp.]
AKTDQLQSLTDEYRHLYDAMEFPVLVFDPDGCLQRFNRAAKEFFGLRSVSIGQPVAGLSLPAGLDGLQANLDQARAEVRSYKQIIRLRGGDWQQMVTPGCNEEGGIESFVFSLVDVTELHRARSELAASRAHLDALLSNSTLLISSKGLDGRYQFANPAFLKGFDLSLEETLGRTDYELFPQPLAGSMWTTDLEVMRGGKAKVVEHEFDDGHTRRIHQATHQLLLDNNGAPERLLIEAEDVTARKRAEAKLRVSAQVLEQAGEGILTTDADTVITSVNQAFTRITGYSAEEAIGSRVGDLLRSGENPSVVYEELWETIQREGFWRGELVDRRKNGELYTELLTINRIEGDDGSYYVAVFSDITTLKELQKQAQYLATHDELTGLPNRSLVYDRLDVAMASAQRHEQRIAVIFLDLDDFKTVNDTFGHDVGDELLVEVAEQLKATLRDSDTLSRQGGDEFMIILPDTTVVGAEQTAARLVEACRQPITLGGQRHFISVSIGVSFYPDDGMDRTTLIKAADLALYRAKHNGRNRFELFRAELQAQLIKYSRMESGLRHALQTEALQLVLQPQFDLAEGVPIGGAEVLLRWRDPTQGTVSPAEFIPVAEHSGLILEIDRYVIERTLAAIALWENQDIPGVPVSINLSVRSLRDDRLVDYLIGRLAHHGVAASQIQIEITEGAFVDRTSVVIDNIEKLREAHIPFAVDDFGTGYSSLSYLKRLPLAELKIDKSFVDGLGGKDRNDESIAQAILSMGQALDLRTVAEGVETEGQLEWLKAHGCDRMQGFLYARPMDIQDFTRLLQERSP